MVALLRFSAIITTVMIAGASGAHRPGRGGGGAATEARGDPQEAADRERRAEAAGPRRRLADGRRDVRLHRHAERVRRRAERLQGQGSSHTPPPHPSD